MMSKLAVIQIVGYKNSGKTTLIGKLLESFKAMNLQVAVIKHDAHGFEMDREGTDTYSHHQHGAAAIAITSPYRTAVIEEQATPLVQLIERFKCYDLILVEGFKREAYPKIVLLRGREDLSLLQELSQVRAYVTRNQDGSRDRAIAAPPLHFGADETQQIAAWIAREAGIASPAP